MALTLCGRTCPCRRNEELARVAKHHGLPDLVVGMRCSVDGQPGTLAGAESGYLLVRFDDIRRPRGGQHCHATWRTEFFGRDGESIWCDPELEVRHAD